MRELPGVILILGGIGLYLLFFTGRKNAQPVSGKSIVIRVEWLPIALEADDYPHVATMREEILAMTGFDLRTIELTGTIEYIDTLSDNPRIADAIVGMIGSNSNAVRKVERIS